MSRQEVLNKIVTHLRKQNRQSVVEQMGKTYCKYLAPNGDMCAAGCLIPPEDYNLFFEGEGLLSKDSLVARYFQARYTKDELEVISDLQLIHDCTLPPEWETRFQGVANRYGLKLLPNE